jgi:hypothetical protein
MGGLIRTKGTKKLAAHFNDEFDTYIAWWRAQQAAAPAGLFNTSGGRNVDLKAITLAVTDVINAGHTQRGDNLVLLPDIHLHPVHQNLEARWLWFLDLANVGAGALSQANHNKIAGAIWHALHDQTGGGIPNTYGIASFSMP